MRSIKKMMEEEMGKEKKNSNRDPERPFPYPKKKSPNGSD